MNSQQEQEVRALSHKILVDAREILVNNKWARRQYRQLQYDRETQTSGMAYCAVGAVIEATSTIPSDVRSRGLAQIVASERLTECVPNNVHAMNVSIIYYNDRIAKTKADVLKVFDCAIEKVEARAKKMEQT